MRCGMAFRADPPHSNRCKHWLHAMQEFLEDFADARPQGGTNLATHIVPERVVLLGRASDSQRRLVHGFALTSQAVASAKRADVEWLRRTDVVAQDAMLQVAGIGGRAMVGAYPRCQPHKDCARRDRSDVPACLRCPGALQHECSLPFFHMRNAQGA